MGGDVLNMSLIILNKNLVPHHLFRKKSSVQSCQISSTFSLMFILKLLMRFEVIDQKFITRFFDFILMYHYNNFGPTSYYFFAEITLL